MNRVFNTTFEVSMRVLLLLFVDGRPKTSDMIAAIDFLTVYGKSFGITDTNLHGENAYKYGEFANRRRIVKQALKTLVVDGKVDVYEKDGGFHFAINDAGETFCALLTSAYAEEYMQTAKLVLAYIGNKTERALIMEINKQSTMTLKAGGYDG